MKEKKILSSGLHYQRRSTNSGRRGRSDLAILPYCEPVAPNTHMYVNLPVSSLDLDTRLIIYLLEIGSFGDRRRGSVLWQVASGLETLSVTTRTSTTPVPYLPPTWYCPVCSKGSLNRTRIYERGRFESLVGDPTIRPIDVCTLNEDCMPVRSTLLVLA